MIIDFVTYVKKEEAREAALRAERDAEIAQQANLEWVLADLLADIQAA